MAKQWILRILAVLIAVFPAAVAYAGEEGMTAEAFYGEYTVRTLYCFADVPVGAQKHAENMDGSTVTIGEDAFVWAQKGFGSESDYRIEPPAYAVEVLTGEALARMQKLWIVDDNAVKMPFQMHMKVTHGEHGWTDESDYFYMDGRVFQVDLNWRGQDTDPVKVMYVYELVPVEDAAAVEAP